MLNMIRQLQALVPLKVQRKNKMAVAHFNTLRRQENGRLI